MFCSRCGTENTKNAGFCMGCGKRLQRTNTRTHLFIAVISINVLLLIGIISTGLYLTRSMPQNTSRITTTALKTEVATSTKALPRVPTPTSLPTTASTPAISSEPARTAPDSGASQYNQGYTAGWSEADADILTFIRLYCSPAATVYLSGYGQEWGQIECTISGSSNTLYYDDNHYNHYGRYWDGARSGYKDRMDKLWNYMWGNCRDTAASIRYSTDANGTHVTCSPN